MLLKAKLYVEKRSKMILLMKESREEEGKERCLLYTSPSPRDS